MSCSKLSTHSLTGPHAQLLKFCTLTSFLQHSIFFWLSAASIYFFPSLTTGLFSYCLIKVLYTYLCHCVVDYCSALLQKLMHVRVTMLLILPVPATYMTWYTSYTNDLRVWLLCLISLIKPAHDLLQEPSSVCHYLDATRMTGELGSSFPAQIHGNCTWLVTRASLLLPLHDIYTNDLRAQLYLASTAY